jgi:hypothetical protein
MVKSLPDRAAVEEVLKQKSFEKCDKSASVLELVSRGANFGQT